MSPLPHNLRHRHVSWIPATDFSFGSPSLQTGRETAPERTLEPSPPPFNCSAGSLGSFCGQNCSAAKPGLGNVSLYIHTGITHMHTTSVTNKHNIQSFTITQRHLPVVKLIFLLCCNAHPSCITARHRDPN